MGKKRTGKCELCGRLFEHKNKRGPTAAYCSGECRRAADENRRKTETDGRKKYIKQCNYCFICYSTTRKEQKYCSTYCNSRSTRTLKNVKILCCICGKNFTPKSKHQKCCSSMCAKIKEGNTKRIYKNYRNRRNEIERERSKNDPKFKLHRNMRRSIHHTLSGKKNYMGWETLVGYSVKDLRRHLEKKFQTGMTWDNYGEWHIDHIIPIAVFNFTKPEHDDFKRCWALKNLQPLWAKENILKNAKLIKHFQPRLKMGI